MRDEAVRSRLVVEKTLWLTSRSSAASIKSRQVAESRERNMHARAGESDRAIKVKMVRDAVILPIILRVADCTRSQPKHLFAGKRKMGKTDRL